MADDFDVDPNELLNRRIAAALGGSSSSSESDAEPEPQVEIDPEELKRQEIEKMIKAGYVLAPTDGQSNPQAPPARPPPLPPRQIIAPKEVFETKIEYDASHFWKGRRHCVSVGWIESPPPTFSTSTFPSCLSRFRSCECLRPSIKSVFGRALLSLRPSRSGIPSPLFDHVLFSRVSSQQIDLMSLRPRSTRMWSPITLKIRKLRASMRLALNWEGAFLRRSHFLSRLIGSP